MIKQKCLALAGVGLLLALPAPGAEQARIPFATTNGIRSWRAVDDDTLYIRSRTNDWYRAELFGPCFGLTTNLSIGFAVRHGSSFDRTSSIVVDGRECRLRSLVQVDGPPPQVDTRTAKAEEQKQEKERDAAREEPKSEGASIPFADLGSIEDWRAVSDRVLFVKGRNDQWYRAELLAPCLGLKFEDTIGFVIDPRGTFDKFSSIVVDGRECTLASLTKSGPPDGSRRASASEE